MQAESLSHIDLSGLFNKKVQFLCLCILCLGLGVMTLIHQCDLFFAKISQATLKAQADQVRIIRQEGMTYPVYTYQGQTHKSLLSHHDQSRLIYVVPHTHIFYSAYEVHHYQSALRSRLAFGLANLSLSLLFYILYRKTPFQS